MNGARADRPDISTWLRRLGLEQYAAAFRENDIDADVLPTLTADDLRELGVASLGHRKKILAAVAALRSNPSEAPPAPEPTDPVADAAPSASSAERRQLTVMFCDLVGSTALAARLDPEDLREIIGAYHHCVAETVRRYDGFVAKYMGDGVLVYFGYPQAHEDDAERAVRAGLALVDAVGRLGPPERLRVRVGIATGTVVVGDLVGSGAAQERGVVGETPNLAARLQALADPGAVVIAASTRRLLGNLFEVRDLGAVELKGFAEPVPAWQMLREGAVESRFEALHAAAALTPLVGRDEEIELLRRRWEQAKGGEGRVVLLAGDPGIGKSRLFAALQERIADEPHTRLRYFCSPYHQDSALHPTIAQLERAAGFEREDGPGARLDKLAALLAPAQPSDEEVSLLAELLSIPTGDRYPPLNLMPQSKRERTFDALLRQLEALARRHPVLMLFEDVHWIDPSSRELLDLTIERLPRLPVLLVVTFRPEFQPPWAGRPHVTLLTLNRLAHREGVALVERILGDHTLPAEVKEEIAERTDGVPLFVEELTKAILEAGPSDGGRVIAATSHTTLAVPATIHASLMARLDRLGPKAKGVAQVGAAIGREFSYELLTAVVRERDAELHDALAKLCASKLVFCRGTPPEARYTFKHALVQDAAYSTLLRGTRRELHARIVDAIEARSPETIERQPELLARHCIAAGLVERAVAYLGRAGERATVRSAVAEAIAHLTTALRLLRDLPPTDARKRQELDVELTLGGAFIAAKGHGASETGQAYARAYTLCHDLDDAPRLARVLAGTFVHHHVRAEVERAQAVAGELLRLSMERGDRSGQAIAHRSLGDSLLHVGKFSAAGAQFQQALDLFDWDAPPLYIGEDMGVSALSFLAITLGPLGFPSAAKARMAEGVSRASRLKNPHTVAFTLSNECRLSIVLHDAARLQELWEPLLTIATAHGLGFFRAQGTIYQGWSLALAGRAQEGISLIENGIEAFRATGATWLLPYHRGLLLATAYDQTKRVVESLALVEEAIEFGARTSVEWITPELHRLKSNLLLRMGHNEQAEVCLQKAMTGAQQQGAKLWELRAVTGLGRVWREQGKRDEARDLLAPVYGWFTEGFDTPDLIKAKALLDELA